MDITTIGGIILAIASILGGQALEGGHAGSLVQATAAIIILGGTLGATAVAFPLPDLLRGLRMGKQALTEKKADIGKLIEELLDIAAQARRDGLLPLEGRLPSIKDPFLRRALGLVVDGVDGAVVRDALETEIQVEYEEHILAAKVFESAGGFAPAVGILGAVLGLIHVMENLSDPSKLGGGIATAFVATVYGVGIANLVLLPMGSKLKRKLTIEKARKTMIAEGVCSIQDGVNPLVLQEKLRAYAGDHVKIKAPSGASSAAPAKAA